MVLSIMTLFFGENDLMKLATGNKQQAMSNRQLIRQNLVHKKETGATVFAYCFVPSTIC